MLLHRFGHHSAGEQAKCKTQRALIVPCLACYHHFAAGKPDRTAAAAPQRILGSVGSALSGDMRGKASLISFAEKAVSLSFCV